MNWVVSEFLGLYWVDSHVIQLVYDIRWWFGQIKEHGPLSLNLGNDVDLWLYVDHSTEFVVD